MKKLLMSLAVALLWSLFILEASSSDSKVQTPQMFKVTYTVVYNAQTLEQAAKTEKEIREQFKDACEVKVSLKANPIACAMDSLAIWNTGNAIILPGYSTNPNSITITPPAGK